VPCPQCGKIWLLRPEAGRRLLECPRCHAALSDVAEAEAEAGAADDMVDDAVNDAVELLDVGVPADAPAAVAAMANRETAASTTPEIPEASANANGVWVLTDDPAPKPPG